MRTAKVFKTGNSQAIRLPQEFRVSDKEVAISRMGEAIVLQPIKKNLVDIYKAMHELKDFMEVRTDPPPQKREDL